MLCHCCVEDLLNLVSTLLQSMHVQAPLLVVDYEKAYISLAVCVVVPIKLITTLHVFVSVSMLFITTAIATMAAVTTASVVPRADYGGWNVTISSTGGSDKQRTETVTGVYANSQFTDNVPVTCHFQGTLNGEVINKLTCDPESFSYEFMLADYDDGYLYRMLDSYAK